MTEVCCRHCERPIASGPDADRAVNCFSATYWSGWRDVDFCRDMEVDKLHTEVARLKAQVAALQRIVSGAPF